MALKLTTGSTISTATANVAITLSSVSLHAPSWLFQADVSNSENIFIGDSNVAVGTGFALGPGEAMEISGENRRGGVDEIYLEDLFIISATSGMALRIGRFARRT